jgi:hypothetical protein
MFVEYMTAILAGCAFADMSWVVVSSWKARS